MFPTQLGLKQTYAVVFSHNYEESMNFTPMTLHTKMNGTKFEPMLWILA